MKLLRVVILSAAIGLRLGAASDAAASIKRVLTDQAAAWNRGDLLGFVESYAEDCTFMGDPVRHGRAQVLARYRKTFPTAAAMGHLTFSNLQVQVLDKHFAVVTGEWHLAREAAVGGYFSLVMKRYSDGWRVLLDHTSPFNGKE